MVLSSPPGSSLSSAAAVCHVVLACDVPGMLVTNHAVLCLPGRLRACVRRPAGARVGLLCVQASCLQALLWQELWPKDAGAQHDGGCGNQMLLIEL